MDTSASGTTGLDIHVFWEVVAILLLVAGNAFFVASEIALTSARRSRIKLARRHGQPQRQDRAAAARPA